jgi:hypothetical protein
MAMTQCECCNANISDQAAMCISCGHPQEQRGAHQSFAWVVVFLLSICSLLGVIWAMFIEDHISAIQQAATVAACIGFTVIPYCYARALEKY